MVRLPSEEAKGLIHSQMFFQWSRTNGFTKKTKVTGLVSHRQARG